MNKPIRKVAIAIALLFLALFVNLNVVQVVQGDDYRNNEGNRRVLLNEYSNPRGQIVVGGRAVARSRKTDDELKYLREYPQGPTYAAVTGYYSSIYGNPVGIEAAENDVLTGKDSRLFGSNLANLLTGRDPKGGSVELTVNAAAQRAAYRAMGKRRGAVVALDPKTGAILAAVSTPSYDPNKLSSHTTAEVTKAKGIYEKDDRNPLSNRAFREVYPPGSMFKVIDTAAALNADDKLTGSTKLPAPNSYWPLEPGRKSACPKNGAAACVENFEGETCGSGGEAPLALALAKSCNTTFSKYVPEKLGGDKLAEQAKKFGIDAPYPSAKGAGDLCNPPGLKVPLPVCRSTPGSTADLSGDDSLAQSAIGQRDVLITPLQAAMISSAIANDGTLMKPYLVAKERRPDLSVLKSAENEQIGSVLDPDRDAELRDMMYGVVESPQGTGGPAKITDIPDVRVGGKTGTADHCADSSKKCPAPHAWFTGFAVERGEPRIAVAVIIEDGGVTGNETTGGLAAAPVAQKVMSAYLRAVR